MIDTKHTFKKYQRGVYDLNHQKRALMPNLIHSLDASIIAMLYNKYKDVSSLYTIHDCFRVTADGRLISKINLYAKISIYTVIFY